MSTHLPDPPPGRAWDRCRHLAGITEQPGQITRRFLTPSVKLLHQTVTQWMHQACMTVRTDAIGNLIGRLPSANPDAPIMLIGSHLDTVVNAGAFDGILGVMLGIDVADALKNKPLPFHLDIIGFSEEEGVRFHTPYFGSRAIIGDFDLAHLSLKDEAGISLDQAIRDFGLDPEKIPAAAYPASRVLGYIEAHIEQGPVLDSTHRPLGIVTAIAAQSKLVCRYDGQAGHAGTVPMHQRRDALAGACELTMYAEALARTNTSGLMCTVGRLTAEPGATNVIPSQSTWTLDIRHPRDRDRNRAVSDILHRTREIGGQRELKFTLLNESHHPAVIMEPALQGALQVAADLITGQPTPQLVSGAGHDAAILSRFCPVGMLFLRNPGGLSHHPHESVSREDVDLAQKTMIDAVARMAGVDSQHG